MKTRVLRIARAARRLAAGAGQLRGTPPELRSNHLRRDIGLEPHDPMSLDRLRFGPSVGRYDTH